MFLIDIGLFIRLYATTAFPVNCTLAPLVIITRLMFFVALGTWRPESRR